MLAENKLGVKTNLIPVEVGKIISQLLSINRESFLAVVLTHVVIRLGDFVNHALGHCIHFLHLIVQMLLHKKP